MAVHFARMAHKHGISRERILYVIEHCSPPIDSPGDEDCDVVLFFGNDRSGAPLQVATVELEGGDLVITHAIIHAMRLRRKYDDLYLEALRWQR